MVKSGRKGGAERTSGKREEQNLSWASTCCSKQFLQAASHRRGVPRHCHNQIHVNGNLQVNFPCTQLLQNMKIWIRLPSTKDKQVLKTGSWKPRSREIRISLWYTFMYGIQLPSQDILYLHCRSASQAAPSCTYQPAVPNTQPAGSTHSPWRICSVLLHMSSVYRTQVPIWNCTSLYGDRAAKCKMEMAQERITPAVVSGRLRSQNIPPRHTVHASSHPTPAYHQEDTEVWGGHYRTSLKRRSLDINSKCNLLHRMYFKLCYTLL